MLSFHAGNCRGILGIHPIKSYSGDKLSWFGEKINNFFLILIYVYTTSMVQGRCKTTELKAFCNEEPLKQKL